jgi:hypothetical protein
MPLFDKRGDNTPELNISGAHVFFMLALAFAAALPMLWLFVKYWIFAP